MRGGAEEASVEVVVRVVDEAPRRFSVTLDNTGNRETGRLRLGLGYQDANANGGDEVLTLQYVSAPYADHLNYEGHATRLSPLPSRRVLIVGAGYRVPLYRPGDSIDFSAGYANVSSGTVAQLFNITGRGTLFGARYTRNFDRIGDYEHRLALGLDWRSYENKGVRPAGGATIQLIPDVVTHPLSLTYIGLWRGQQSETGISFGAARNFAGGNDGRQEDFCAARNNQIGECADANYTIWRWAVNHNRALAGDWQARVGLNGQWTRDMLVTGEQFGLGGADSVRGFAERDITNDLGHRGTLELYTPDFGARTGLAGARVRALGFVDWGRVSRNRPGPAEPHGQSVRSYGVGLRFSRGSDLALRLDYGIVHDEGGTQGRGDSRLHASLSYVF
jgi:hemolysin activation/secretion protein